MRCRSSRNFHSITQSIIPDHTVIHNAHLYSTLRMMHMNDMRTVKSHNILLLIKACGYCNDDDDDDECDDHDNNNNDYDDIATMCLPQHSSFVGSPWRLGKSSQV
jgi:hypothetical protein